jgi:hypothetical protein
VERFEAIAPALRSQHVKELPSLSQTKWGEQIFRPAFEGEAGIDFSNCIELGELCYISYGLRPLSADDAPMSFSRDDVLSGVKQAPYTKRFVEGKNIQPYYLTEWQWLEWGTSRVPTHLYRKTFLELYTSPKIIIGETSGVYYDGEGDLFDDHSTRNAVPYHQFSSSKARQYIGRVMARRITHEDIAALDLKPTRLAKLSKTDLAKKVINARAKISPNYDLRYITALLNCRWLRGYMMAFVRRGSRRRFYPDDLKQWPIAPADADTQAQIARLVDEIMNAKADVQRWRDEGHRIDEDGVLLNPRPFLDIWGISHGDLIDASGFLSYDINGSITTIERDGQRLVFRKSPLSYIKSEHDHVLDYLALYLETNREALDAVPASQMAREIRIPHSPAEVQRFLQRLEGERGRVILRWMAAAQHENLIDEWAFDLYDVADDRCEKLGGPLYTLDGMPDGLNYISIMDDADDSPMRRVAFQKDGVWCYRTEESLPDVVVLWMHDGQRVTTRHGVVGETSIAIA